jgi:hypothetical protein
VAGRLLGGFRHFRSHDGAEVVDAGQSFRRFDVPKSPAVAGFQPLRLGTYAVDGADRFAERERAVGAD